MSTNRYWVSPTESNWNNTANWDASSGGSGGYSVPDPSTDVYFDNSGLGICLIDVPPTIHSSNVLYGYDSTIIQNGNAINASYVSFDGGVFLGDPSSIQTNTVYLGRGIVQDSTINILQDMSCASTHNQWSLINNSNFIVNGTGQQNVYVEAGGIVPTLTINKIDSTQVMCFGDNPVIIKDAFIILDGTFNTNGLDLQIGI